MSPALATKIAALKPGVAVMYLGTLQTVRIAPLQTQPHVWRVWLSGVPGDVSVRDVKVWSPASSRSPARTRRRARVYAHGDYTIAKEQSGYAHGVQWTLRRGAEILDAERTLKRLFRTAAAELGIATDAWTVRS